MTESERIAELTARAQRGGEGAAEAFEALYSTYGKRVYYFCRCLLGDEEAAIDTTRSVFLYAWRNLRSMPAGQTFYRWVCGNAFYFVKIALAGLRGTGLTVEELDEDPALLDESVSLQAAQAAPEINVRRSHLDAVTEQLSALTDADRICVMLYDYARFPAEEISGMLGCSEDTVKCRVYRGHEALCAGLEACAPGNGALFRPYLDKLIRTCGKNCTLPEAVTERIRAGLEEGDAVEFPAPPADEPAPDRRAISPIAINRICILLGLLFAAALTYILYWFLSSPKVPADPSGESSFPSYESSAVTGDTASDVLSGVSQPEEGTDEPSSEAASSEDESEPEESTSSEEESSEETSGESTSSASTEESSAPQELGELPRTTERLKLRTSPAIEADNIVTTIPAGAHIDILDTVTAEDGSVWYEARYTVRSGLWYEGYCSADYVQTEE